MTAQDNLTPTWRPYADQVIQTLLAHHGHRALVANPLSALDDGDAEPYDLDGIDQVDSVRARTAQNPRPALPLSPRSLSLAIRLAATFGSEAGMHAACAPGAITVIHGFGPEEQEPARRVLAQAFLPPGLQARDDLRRIRRGTGPGGLILLAPEIRSGGDDRSARRQFRLSVEEALSHDLPLILLVPDAGMVPGALPEVAQMLRLVPLSGEVLLAHLAHSHGVLPQDEPAIRAALPTDRLLAGLTSTALLLALRAPEAKEVAARLARLTAPAATDGPRLETMRGKGLPLRTARRMVVDLQNWQAGRIGWGDLSHSLLLYGPPGTGKTWLARAMGNSAGVTMITGSFAEWQAAGHLGDMLRAMRATFAEARRQAPSLLFIDEIDAVGSREDGDRHGSSYRTQVINGFLAEMDSLAREPGVIVVGACNDPSRIDPAVLRPGRFDLKIPVPLPDTSMILGVLEQHLANSFQKDELEHLARSLTGHSAAAIDAAIRAARSEARHAGRALTPDLIRWQLGITDDPARRMRDRRVAIHECGHAIVAAALDRGQPTRILITPEGGETHRRDAPHDGRLAEYHAELAVLLAGRAAERLILGEASSGAGGAPSSDLARATQLALQIETQSGLGDAGPVWSDVPAEIALRDPAIRRRVRQRLETAEAQATNILTDHRALLEHMADHLQRQRELAGDDLRRWLADLTPARSDIDSRAQIATASVDGLQGEPQDAAKGTAPNGSHISSGGDRPRGRQTHPDHARKPHCQQDDPEIRQENPAREQKPRDPDQAI